MLGEDEEERMKRVGEGAASRSESTFSSGSVRGWIGVTAQVADASSCVVVDGWCTESRINPGWRRLTPPGEEHVTRRAIRGTNHKSLPLAFNLVIAVADSASLDAKLRVVCIRDIIEFKSRVNT